MFPLQGVPLLFSFTLSSPFCQSAKPSMGGLPILLGKFSFSSRLDATTKSSSKRHSHLFATMENLLLPFYLRRDWKTGTHGGYSPVSCRLCTGKNTAALSWSWKIIIIQRWNYSAWTRQPCVPCQLFQSSSGCCQSTRMHRGGFSPAAHRLMAPKLETGLA